MRATWVLAVLLGGLVAGVGAIPATAADDEALKKQRIASAENLKQIGIAFHGFHDKNLVMPADVVSNDGKPLLSWRVAILPFVEEEKLFGQFRFNEPWDSEHNKKLVEKMPRIYAPVRGKAKPGMTFYQTFSGKGALFEPGNLVLRIPQSIPDGTSNTALVVEAGEPVIWTKPADLPFDQKKALPKLGGLFDGDFHVVMCDGSVYLLKKNPDEKLMKLLIRPNDGQAFDLGRLKKN